MQGFDDIACCVGFVCELPFEDLNEHSHRQLFIKHEQKLQAKTTAGIADDIHGASFVDGAVSGDPMDQNGHGTFVAGQQPPMCVDHFGRANLFAKGVTVTVKQCALQSHPYNSCVLTALNALLSVLSRYLTMFTCCDIVGTERPLSTADAVQAIEALHNL